MKTCLIIFFIIWTGLHPSLYAQAPSMLQVTDQSLNVFGEKKEHLNNFTGSIYFIPTNTWKLPDFSTLVPVGEIFTDCLYIPDQDFNKGFPGVTNRFEYFAIDYKGQFYLKESGNYVFRLCSDDGSQLWIDSSLIIDLDLQHSVTCRSNYVSLKEGSHSIEVQYFQGPRDRVALVLYYKGVDEAAYRLFNLSEFYPISVNEQDTTIDISIGNEILFDFDSYALSPVAREALSEIKRIIIDETAVKSIIIEGHTDDIGSDDYNLKLSLLRADAVKDYFTQIGVDPTQIKTKGAGKVKPKVPNLDDESRKQNRRIEMTIIKEEILNPPNK